MKNLIIFYSVEGNKRLITSTISNNNKEEAMKKSVIWIKELIE